MSSFSADSKAAASGEDVAENALMEYVTELLDDAPKLQVALKNLMAVLLGSDASRRTADDELDGKVTDIKAFDLLICSKTLIKCVSELSFAEAPQWGVEHPQREDQNFSDRIAEISQYKAALLFFSRAKTSESGISKIVGRKFLQRTKCMPAIRLNVKEKLASKVEDDIIELFLNTFDDSVKGNIVITIFIRILS